MPHKHKYDFIRRELERRRAAAQLRRLRPVKALSATEVEVEGRTLINFSSNDYLGLAFDPRLRRRAREYLRASGAGATASRLGCGTHPGFARVEERLAQLKGTEKALVLNSGFQANVSLLPALADRRTLVLADRLCHSSLLQGIAAGRGRVRRYRHGDLEHLRALLEESRAQKDGRILVVTESVFSMDGDQSDIGALVRLAEEFGALLLVDEAHATGVLGPRGMGLCHGGSVDLVVGTFGKALGSFGAYVACSELMWEYLVNCCAGFVYSTALPPAVLGSIEAALELVPAMDPERARLHARAEFARGALERLGWKSGNSTTQIVPLVVGAAREALALAQWLEAQGVLAPAIRPPTVAAGQARLRLSFSAAHTREQLEYLVGCLERWRARSA